MLSFDDKMFQCFNALLFSNTTYWYVYVDSLSLVNFILLLIFLISRNIYYYETERQVQIHMTTKQGHQNITFDRNNDHDLFTQLKLD